MMFLARAGIVTPAQYAAYRKYAILIAVVVGAILTPPDPVTQILLASPVFFLYELGILLSRLTAKKREASE
jgi:sec-independent protein translocase protein TatC